MTSVVSVVMAFTTFFLMYGTAQAVGQITGRSLTLGSSVANATTTYSLTFTLPTTGTVVKSVDIQICDTASLTCVNPGSFSAASAVANQPTNLGATSGWTTTDSTTNDLKLANGSNASTPSGATTVSFSSVHNPSATNSSFYGRINTYSAVGYTGAIDFGTVVASTAGQITVTASVDETLTFTLSSATVALGTLSTSAAKTGTNSLSAATNASGGYAISVHGATLQSGSNSIAALTGSGGASSPGTSQFGLNFVANTSPTVGTAPSGGSGAAFGNYATPNTFTFNDGDEVASVGGPSNTTNYVTSYLANISGSQPPGAYSTTLTYIATATF